MPDNKIVTFSSYFNTEKNVATCSLYEDKIVLETKSSVKFAPYYSNKSRIIAIKDIKSVILRAETSWLRAHLSYMQFQCIGSNERPAADIVAYIQKHPVACYDEVSSLLDNGTILLGKNQEQVINNISAAEKIKEYVEKKILEKGTQTSGDAGLSDELLKLHSLFEKGILLEEEYQAAKRRLLNMK